MKKTVEYKGFQASVEFADGTLFVKVLHIDDLLVAEIDSAAGAQKALEELIDAYLLDCIEEGREPSQPFKGSFNVRVTPDLHRRVAMRAADEGMTLNKWICLSIEEKLECGKLSERIDGVLAKSKAQADSAVVAQWVRIFAAHTDHHFHNPFQRQVRLHAQRWNDEPEMSDALLRKAAAGSPWTKLDA